MKIALKTSFSFIDKGFTNVLVMQWASRFSKLEYNEMRVKEVCFWYYYRMSIKVNGILNSL